MLLRPEYTYLFLDFETTGLDTLKDDPIQIGLLLMDHEGSILKTFSSPLHPNKPISELKSIVTYLTQTSLEQLQHAPSMKDIIPSIRDFFGESTVLIGHNVAFDKAFLSRYIDWTPYALLDTFPLSKACLHFLPSYALEVIARQLALTAENAHDALGDCLMTRELFLHCIRHLQEIRSSYLIFDYVLQNSQTQRAQVLARTTKNYDFAKKTLFLPPLVKPTQASKKLIQPDQVMITSEHIGKEREYYIGHTTLATFLAQLQRDKAHRLLCFSHKAKLSLAENCLTTQGIPTALLNDANIFLPERIDLFLHKGSFDEGELFFVAKYLSHHLQAHTLIDINSSDDYKIFNTLTEQKPPRPGQVTLATHEQLYTYTHHLDPLTHVLFFDVDRRWQTRGNKNNDVIDPHYMLQFLEHAEYKATLLHDETLYSHIKNLTVELNLLFGILGGEIDHLFQGYSSNTLEIENIVNHTRLPKSRAILETFRGKTLFLEETNEVALRRRKQQERIKEMFYHTTIVNRMMYQGDKWRYTFSAPSGFHTFDEMKEQLPPATYSFLSTLHNQSPALGKQENITPFPINETIHRPDQLLTFLEKQSTNIFVLSANKTQSQDLFQQLINAKKDESRLIVTENITGGVGKIVYLATQSQKPVIMIGGFGCYLAARAKKFAISTLLAYYCEGKQKPLLIADIQFYRSPS